MTNQTSATTVRRILAEGHIRNGTSPERDISRGNWIPNGGGYVRLGTIRCVKNWLAWQHVDPILAGM